MTAQLQGSHLEATTTLQPYVSQPFLNSGDLPLVYGYSYLRVVPDALYLYNYTEETVDPWEETLYLVVGGFDLHFVFLAVDNSVSVLRSIAEVEDGC